MKKLSLHIFLLLLWCNIGFSNDIKEFEIDGIKIYDNIYDILTDEIISENIEKIKDSKLYGGNKEFPWLLINPNKIIDQSKVLNNYDFIKIHYKKKDNQIHLISGTTYFGDLDMRQCINNLNSIKFRLDNIYNSPLKRNETGIIPHSSTRLIGATLKSVSYTYPDFGIRIICYDFTEYKNFSGPKNRSIRFELQGYTHELSSWVNKNNN
tara:strand:+ start:212 stop:838 length:627 start_codon:yes stop_codon:yes gene_type:complete